MLIRGWDRGGWASGDHERGQGVGNGPGGGASGIFPVFIMLLVVVVARPPTAAHHGVLLLAVPAPGRGRVVRAPVFIPVPLLVPVPLFIPVPIPASVPVSSLVAVLPLYLSKLNAVQY